VELEQLIQASENPVMRSWQKLNPQAKDWNLTAKDTLVALNWSKTISDKNAKGSHFFIYENSLTSCQQFTKSYENYLTKQKVVLFSSIFVFIVLLGVFIRFRYIRSS